MLNGNQISPKRRALLNQLLQKQGIKVIDARIPPEQGIVTGEVPLTPSQAWFFKKAFIDQHWWNMPHAFKINRSQIKPDLLEQAVRHILSHHDALRARFVCDNAGWKQIIDAPDEIASPFRCIDLSALPKDERDQAASLAKTEAQKSLDLAIGPLLQVILLDIGTMRSQVVIVVHHLVTDMSSVRVIIDDLLAVYQQLLDGKPVQLPPKTTSLKAWSECISRYVQSPEFERRVDKWRALPWAQTAPLPVDYPDGKAKNIVDSIDVVWTSLSADETAILLKDVPRVYGAQVVEALLMVLVETIAGWTAKPWITINMIKSGRTDEIPGTEHMDLTRTVGFLAMGEILFLEHRKTKHLGEASESIKEQFRGARGEAMILHMARLSSQYEEKGRFPDYVEDLSFNYFNTSPHPALGIGGMPSAPTSAGKAKNGDGIATMVLGCSGTISGNRLIWYWDYSKNVYERATIEKIAASFMASLRALLAHCQSVARQNSMQDIA